MVLLQKLALYQQVKQYPGCLDQAGLLVCSQEPPPYLVMCLLNPVKYLKPHFFKTQYNKAACCLRILANITLPLGYKFL
jgi:hypothetical protein